MNETPLVTEEEIDRLWKEADIAYDSGEPFSSLRRCAHHFAQAVASLAAKRAVEKWGHVERCRCNPYEREPKHAPHESCLTFYHDPRCALADRKPE